MSLNGTYMSTAEVSDALGITPSSVHRLVREGFLGVKDTKQYKSGWESNFDCSEVNKLLPMMPALRRKWQQAEDSRLGAKKAAFQRADAAEKAVRHTGIKRCVFYAGSSLVTSFKSNS